MRTLLLGMGNPILSDDAIGVRLAAELGRRLPPRPDLDVREECSVGGLNLLDVLTGYQRVIVLDAVKTAAGVPGDVYRFSAGDLGDTLHLTNIHDVNLTNPNNCDKTHLTLEIAANITNQYRDSV